jgi:hypothetical protein
VQPVGLHSVAWPSGPAPSHRLLRAPSQYLFQSPSSCFEPASRLNKIYPELRGRERHSGAPNTTNPPVTPQIRKIAYHMGTSPQSPIKGNPPLPIPSHFRQLPPHSSRISKTKSAPSRDRAPVILDYRLSTICYLLFPQPATTQAATLCCAQACTNPSRKSSSIASRPRLYCAASLLRLR